MQDTLHTHNTTVHTQASAPKVFALNTATSSAPAPRAKRGEKRERLIQAADQLITEKSYHTTTLADIAQVSGVPLGNVYYYFKTKEDIMHAVIQKRTQELKKTLESLEKADTPKDRLLALIQHMLENAADMAQHGDKMGTLCQELSKAGHLESVEAAREMMSMVLRWTQKQFAHLNGEHSGVYAEQLIAHLQGIALVTLSFRDAHYMRRHAQILSQWIERVATHTSSECLSVF